MQSVSSSVGDPKGKIRLMITKMVLENFKSYAGSQEIGPFHKRFSSVVGPNGSGKSNVIDALLFVFGKKAKDLRLKKVSGLIHKSSGFPNLEFCKVEVHFQLIYDDEESADDFEVVPGSEFIVSRSADQKNQSKYIVDGKGSTWTEVGVLLKKHGIDTDNNRFLILQGEVEQIAMMKPKGQKDEDGLLEYLEDIIGSNIFVEKIDEVGKTLEDFNEQRVDKVNRLKRADKERHDLSSSKEGAEEFIAREKEIRKRQNILYQVHENIALDNVKEFATRRDDAKVQLEQERAKKKECEDQLKVLDDAYANKKAEYEAASKELAAVSSNFAAYERKDLELQENMKHSKTKIDKLKNDILNDKKKGEDCRREADEALVTVNNAKARIADFTANKEAEESRLEEINEGLREATQGLRDRLEGTQAQLAEAERATASIQTEKESAANCLQLLFERSKSVVKTVSATQNKMSVLGEEAEKADARRHALEGEKKDLELRVKAMESQICSSAQDEESVQSSLRNALIALEDARATLLSQESGSRGGSKELDRLMAAAKKGGPLQNVGMRGRLGDLATIHPEFDVAVSTACGLLDYIVVDTPEGGQACISYLREHNIGRANFVVLTQAGQHKTAMERSQGVKFPEGSKRLFDLITPSDPALLPAFYMALRDTLVAKDLDAAVAMAYQGGKPMWRVVTLEGNLIETSGSMSGGGKTVKSGGMRLSGTAAPRTTATAIEETVTSQQITSLEVKVSQCEAQLMQCRSSRKNAQTAVKDCNTRSKAIEIELAKLVMVHTRIQEQTKEISARLVALRIDTDLSQEEAAEVAILQSRISSLDGDIARASPDSLTLKRAVTSLQQQIRAVGGPKLAEAQAKVDRIVAQLLLQNKMMVEKEVVETNSRNQATKAAGSLGKAEKDLNKVQEKLSAYQAELEEMEEDAVEMIGAMTAATESVETQNEQLKVLMKENDDMNAKMKFVRLVESKLKEGLEGAERELDKNSTEARRWRAQLENLKDLHIKEQSDFNAKVSEVLKAVRLSNAAAFDPTSGSHSAVQQEEEEEEEETLELLPELSVEKLLSGRNDKEELTREIGVLEAERAKQEKHGVNMPALMAWIKKNGEYRLRLADLEAITLLRNSARKDYEALRGQRLEMFMSGFGVISLKLKEMYQMITLGGDAELELLDSLDPFSEGIVFSVRPPKKSWKNISNLSGGEKTLSSLALVFALHHYKPTPLYVMDEIDAALDFKNVSIVANYIKERTKNAQFIIISLRNNMFELADRLVGIYKTHDATKSVTINPRMFSEAAANKGLQAERRSLTRLGEDEEEEERAVVTGVRARVKMALGDATNII